VKIPVLQDHDIVLYESDAIVFYLEQKYPEKPVFPIDFKNKALALVHLFVPDPLFV
jgi:glutathione S-transferase